jgi:REP element-mobilizing transposase RayT
MRAIFLEENRGTIETPYYYQVYNKNEILQVNFSEIYKGCYSFWKYGIMQFNIKSDNINTAIEIAKDRISDIMANGYPKRGDIVMVTGYRYDDNNTKIPHTLTFMENTHIRNQFTANTYKTKAGDLLKYDCDGDGWGFWYAVDENGKRTSDRLKAGIFIGYLSDGIIVKKK